MFYDSYFDDRILSQYNLMSFERSVTPQAVIPGNGGTDSERV